MKINRKERKTMETEYLIETPSGFLLKHEKTRGIIQWVENETGMELSNGHHCDILFNPINPYDENGNLIPEIKPFTRG